MITSGNSFKLISRQSLPRAYSERVVNKYEVEDTEIDDKKRAFLKLAGVVGVGALATTLIPKKAEAFMFGSSPSSTTMGVKNSSGTKINPATEDTLAGMKAKTDLMTFDNGTSPGNLNVNVVAGGVNLKNLSGTTISPATEDTLAAIKLQTDKLTFTGSGPATALQTSVGGTGNIVGIKDKTSTQINPATEDSLVYLRRIVKLLESVGTIDSQQRQKVVVDGFGSVVTGIAGSVAGVPRVTLANDTTISATITTLAGWNDGMFADPARTAYSIGIRGYLKYT